MKKRIVVVAFALLITGCSNDEIDDAMVTTDFVSLNTASSDKGTWTETSIEGSVEDNYFEESSEPILEAEIDWTYENIKERYPEKTILHWVGRGFEYDGIDFEISNNAIRNINDYLSEIGEEFVVYFEKYNELIFEDKINELIVDGNAPDIISAGYVGGKYGADLLLNNEWMQPLDSYLLTDLGEKVKQSFPDKYLQSLYQKGHFYGFTSFPCYRTTYFVNKELMDKYNLTEEMFQNVQLDELEEIFKKVYDGEQDNCQIIDIAEDGSFISDFTFAVNNMGAATSLLAMRFEDENPKVFSFFESDRTKEWLKKIAEYRSAGYMENSEKLFLEIGKTVPGDMPINAIRNYNKFGSEDNIVMIPCDEGVITQKITFTGVCSMAKNVDIAWRALALFMTDQYIVDQVVYGEKSNSLKDDYGYMPSGAYNQMAAFSYANDFVRSLQISENVSSIAERISIYDKMKLTPQAGLFFDVDEYAEIGMKLDRIANGYSGLLVGKYPNVDEKLDELNVKLKEAGIEKILDEMNRQLSEYTERE